MAQATGIPIALEKELITTGIAVSTRCDGCIGFYIYMGAAYAAEVLRALAEFLS